MKIKLLTTAAVVLLSGLAAVGQIREPQLHLASNSVNAIGAANLFGVSAQVISSKLVHRVRYNDKWWMVVHVELRIKNAMSVPCKIAAYFYDADDNTPLDAGDGTGATYTTANEHVYAEQDFTPGLEDAYYKDLTIYVPYEALNLETTKGSSFNLEYFLNVTDYAHKYTYTKTPYYKFSLTY